MEELIAEFLAEAREGVDAVDEALVRLEAVACDGGGDAEAVNAIFRIMHSIKGTSGFLGLVRLEAVTHAAETLLGRFRDGDLPVTPEAVTPVLGAVDRVRAIMAALAETGAEPAGDDAGLIEALAAAARDGGPEVPADPEAAGAEAPTPDPTGAFEGETFGRDAFGGAAAEAPGPAPAGPRAAETGPAAPRRAIAAEQGIRVGVDVLEDMMTLISELVLTRNQLLQVNRRQADEAFAAPLQRLSSITGELQDAIMKTRVQPIGAVWRKLPRLVRDLSHEVGKTIRLELEGEATELDRQVLDLIRDPLTHMVRNSADHGIEAPEERLAAGKPAAGTIRVSAAHESGSVIVTVADDGRGLDPVRLRRKAVAKGLLGAAEAEAMPDAQVQRLIFAPGFSTAEAVTNLSGRGVGMDVVRSNIEQIGGQIDLDSHPGRGTSFRIRIPLTLAIMPALVVGAGGQRFALPQSSVLELVRLRADGDPRLDRLGDMRLLRLRDLLAPVTALHAALGLPDPGVEPRFAVVADIGGRRFGLLVDEVLDTEEIVVKPLSARLREIPRFAGATILGDGSVVLIVDMRDLAALAGEPPARDGQAELVEAWLDAVRAEDAALLLVETGGPCPMAIDLTRVTRLELAPAERIVEVGGRPALRGADRLMPIAPLGATRLRRSGAQPLVVVGVGADAVALAVEAISDILRAPLRLDLPPARPGLLGSAVVNGAAVEVVDVDHHRRAAAAPALAERAA